MKATVSQQQAIDDEGTNIIVSAGAGSGKTAVLSERVLRKVKDGVDIRKILVLTFTNEAAGEMKSRIRKKIKEAGIEEQLEYIDAAYITTFDAYALAIVKKYHYLLNISKNIAIIDSSVIELEKKRLLEDIFKELYEKKDEDFLSLVGDFTNRDDDIIKEAILGIKKSLDLKYDKLEYLEHYIDNFYNDNYIDKIFEEYFNYLKELSEVVLDNLVALEDMLDSKLYTKVYDSYIKYTNIKTYNDLYKIKDKITIQFRNIPEEAIEYKDNLKNTVNKITELTKYSEEELKKQIWSTKKYVRAIIKVINLLDERLNAYKRKQEAYEFLDIAKMAIFIVKNNEDIREELKNSYNEILIDEYQDTNDLQEMFIQEIENNNVYMVGDIKQSIYRFRNANPNIFKEKYDNYKNNIGGKKIDLLENFRSRKEVLDNINEIFDLIMTEDIGGVKYLGNHEMVYGNLAYINEGMVKQDSNMDILKYDKDNKDYSDAQIEAFIIAHDIKEKISKHYLVYDMDKGCVREALYSDFCIILDRGSDMPLYKKIFEYEEIPMDVYKDSDLTSSLDILVFKNIISLILCIKDKVYDIKMKYYFTSIARSFLGNLSDAEIFNIKCNNSYFETDIFKKCQKIAKNIDSKTPSIILEDILKEFNVYENLITVGDISERITKIEYLEELSCNAEDLGFTISDFRDYLEEVIKGKEEIRYKEAKEDLNCVKLMNIHRSKGLQFPICYFAGFKKDFNLSDIQSRFMFDKKYGILTPFYDEGIDNLFVKELIKNAFYQEEISEKIRLFYVALTRAQEKIIMVVPEFKKPLKQKGPISKVVGSDFRSFYNFIEAIAYNLDKYVKIVDLKEIGLTKDYQFIKNGDLNLEDSKKKIYFKDNNIDSKLIVNKHASKTIKNIITKEEAKTLEYGTLMHEMLEETDFKDMSITNKYVLNLRNTFDFQKPKIYQELEFIMNDKDTEYHGIIDLMLEYDEEIKIIDYKLKNIDDEEYIKQLNVYYNYIKQVSDKKVSLYLYSIMDNKVKEVPILSLV